MPLTLNPSLVAHVSGAHNQAPDADAPHGGHRLGTTRSAPFGGGCPKDGGGRFGEPCPRCDRYLQASRVVQASQEPAGKPLLAPEPHLRVQTRDVGKLKESGLRVDPFAFLVKFRNSRIHGP